jgi:hypothetical protein
MSTQNLWGELPVVEKIRTPLSILREQATVLSQMSERLLEGEVMVTSDSPDQIEAQLNIVAPTLGGYSVTILSISYGLDLYPILLQHALEPSIRKSAKDEQAFIVALQQVLTSESVRKVISALLTQIRSIN